MVNRTCKAIIKQMANESAVDVAFADPLGIVCATIFSKPDVKPGGIPITDIFWAKFHRVHPVLFGILGDPSTAAGATALGFTKNIEGREDWMKQIKGMSRGFAALTLRDFSRSSNENPFPNRLYWEALARITMTPPDKQLALQYAALDGMLEPVFVPKFIKFYGSAAIAALKHAIITFPATRDKRKSPTIEEWAKNVEKLVGIYEYELFLRL